MTNWRIVDSSYNTTFTFFFFLLAFFAFYIAIKGYKSNNRYGGTSTIVCGFLFITFGYYNSIFGFLPYPYNGFMIWWIGIILSIFFAFAFIIKKVISKMDPEKGNSVTNANIGFIEKQLRTYVELMTKESPYKESISIKMEAIRKSFHLAGLLFLFSYFWFILPIPVTEHVNNGVIEFIKETEDLYNVLWGDIHAQYPYVKADRRAIVDLTAFALIATLVLTIISDLIRVLWGPEYSIFNFLTKAVLRNKEHNALGPQIYLITGVIFSYMLFLLGLVDIMIVVAATLIACFSDAAAALVGRKYGKHKVKCLGGDLKSVEGFSAGTGLAFVIALITVGPVYALIAALIFFVLDYFPVVIADNLLNPIAITIGLGIVFAVSGYPIGWI